MFIKPFYNPANNPPSLFCRVRTVKEVVSQLALAFTGDLRKLFQHDPTQGGGRVTLS